MSEVTPPGLDQVAGRTFEGPPAQLVDFAMSLAELWSLTVGEPLTGGRSKTWAAPGQLSDGTEVILKVTLQHPEAEDEVDGLRVWDGDGAVRLFTSATPGEIVGLVVERCTPGAPPSVGGRP